jgi:hypothetical protein
MSEAPPLDPAATVLRLLGEGDLTAGITAVAEATSRDRTSVLRWTYAKERGGTGGLIPARHHQDLLRLARERSVSLEARHLIGAEVAA